MIFKYVYSGKNVIMSNMKTRWIKKIMAVLIILAILVPAAASLRSKAAQDGRGSLVIEVIEDIPADQMVSISDEEVPLSAWPQPDRSPMLPYSVMVSAAAVLLLVWWANRMRIRMRLLQVRKEGYLLEEANRRR